MRKLIISLFSLMLIASNLYSDKTKDEATIDLLYSQAITLMKEDHKTNAPKTVALLTKARGILQGFGDKITPEQEALLIKINGHIYWQNKWSSAFATKVTNVEIDEDLLKEKIIEKRKEERIAKKSSENDSEATEAKSENKESRKAKKEENAKWAKERAKERAAYEALLKKVVAYEKSHPNDYNSNLLNYVELQSNAIDSESAEKAFEKTQFYNQKLENEKKELAEKTLSSFTEYEDYKTQKDYKEIVRRLSRLKLSKSLSPKQRSFLNQLSQEMHAMSLIKATLISHGRQKAIPLPDIFSGYRGVISNIDDKGIQLLDRSVKIQKHSLITWSVFSEDDMLQLASLIIKPVEDRDIYIMAISHLRLKNYSMAFDYFNKLIAKSSTNYLKYRHFLAQCEVGHRIKKSAIVEGKLKEALVMNSKKQTSGALEVMADLYSEHLTSTLGKNFLNRYLMVYRDIN